MTKQQKSELCALTAITLVVFWLIGFVGMIIANPDDQEVGLTEVLIWNSPGVVLVVWGIIWAIFLGLRQWWKLFVGVRKSKEARNG